MTQRVAFVAPLPPPIHGFSNICAAMLRLLNGRVDVTSFDRAPTANAALSAIRQASRPLAFLVWCLRNRRSHLYLALSGGLGQLLDALYLLIGRVCGRRIFTHHHSFAYLNTPSLLNRLVFFFLRRETHIVLSQRMGDELARIYRLNPRNIRVISNAAFYGPADAPPPAESPAPIRLGYLSNISIEKGILEFFAVVGELRRLRVAYVARIAGPVAAAAQGAFHESLSSSDAIYVGPVHGEAKDQFYDNLDILLFPTDYVNEAEPLVIHEAIRRGVHVLACDRGAITEILANGAGMVTAKSSFTAAAVRKICDLAADRRLLDAARRASFEQSRRMRDIARGRLAALLDEISSHASPSGNALSTGLLCFAYGCACCVAGVGMLGSNTAVADVEYRDTLERALLPPVEDSNRSSDWDVFVGGQAAYDSNLYRLPSNVEDLTTLIGPHASRDDTIYTGSVGVDGQWQFGKQLILLSARADDNRFDRNDNLDNISSSDTLTWNWGLGDVLTGQVGADYSRSLAGFYNTNIYTRDLVDRSEWFAAARYQIGPHVSTYAGVLYADTSLTAAAAAVNDNHRKTLDLGLDLATGVVTSVGLDYRYTDARYAQSTFLNGVRFDPDYRDDALRLTFAHTLSEKTQIEAIAGYLKRDYPTAAIGEFSGYVWRLSADWHPTEKTEVVLAGSRDLQADLSAQTDYFVSNAISISPSWIPTEKITMTLTLSRDQQDYIGTSQFTLLQSNRHDLVNAQQINVIYSPLYFASDHALTFNILFRSEHRTSNQAESSYDDKIGKAAVNYKF